MLSCFHGTLSDRKILNSSLVAGAHSLSPLNLLTPGDGKLCRNKVGQADMSDRRLRLADCDNKRAI